jgi:hypothetical protein
MLGEEELARILTELEINVSDEEAKQLVAIKVRTRK